MSPKTMKEHLEEENKKPLRQRIREQLKRDFYHMGGSKLTPQQEEKLIDQLVEQHQAKQIEEKENWKEEFKTEVAKKLDMFLKENKDDDK